MYLYHTDPAQPLTTAGEELDYLDRDLSDLSARAAHPFSNKKSRLGQHQRIGTAVTAVSVQSTRCLRLCFSSDSALCASGQHSRSSLWHFGEFPRG